MGNDIGIITSHMSFDRHGGANYSRHCIAEELEAAGHNVTIYTLNFADENSIPIEYNYELVKTRVDSKTIVDGTYSFLKNHVAGYFEDNDIVHVYVPGIIPLVALYKRISGTKTPAVATLNGYTPFCTDTSRMADGCWENCSLADKMIHAYTGVSGNFTSSGVPRMIFNDIATIPLMNELNGYLCLSPAVRRIYKDIGVNEELLHIVPNMLDRNFETQQQKSDIQEPSILYVGRVDAMKSIGNLLEAVSRMSQQRNFTVEIVGDNILDYGKELDEYRKDAHNLGIADRVTFHGWIDYHELSDYYNLGDVFVHPAEWPEPFGRTIIEAMSHGLPIVSTDVGAPPWITGSAGITYPRNDPESLAQVLEGLFDNPDRLDAMAANTSIELERFDPDLVRLQIEQAYNEAKVNAEE